MSFAPRNHPRRRDAQGRISNDPALVPTTATSDEVDDRRTPLSFFERMQLEHGFTLDVAANGDNAKCARFFDRAMNGLSQNWTSEVVWCNPPYSDLYAWTYKALAEVAWGGCRKVVMLLPANRTEQRWWQDLIEPIRDRGLGVTTRNVRGRIKFEGPVGLIKSVNPTTGASPPFGCVVVIIERMTESNIKLQPIGTTEK